MLNGGDHLIGLRAQSMGGPKAAVAASVYVANFAVGNYSFVVPRDGLWKFVGWGNGGSTGTGGQPGQCSGAYIEVTRFLVTGQTVAIAVPAFSTLGGATTITLPDGSVVSAGCAVSGAAPTPGVATGGDVNINGTATNGAGAVDGLPGGGTGGGAGGLHNGTNAGGAGAPANLPFLGGVGGGGQNTTPPGTGAGGGGSTSAVFAVPGLGLVIAIFVG